MSSFTLELGLGVVMLVVFGASLAARGNDRRWIAWVATLGILALGIVSAFVKPTPPTLFGMFVQDGLSIFAKRLFLVATFIGFLAGISRDGVACGRRAGEYHLLILSSLLGMVVLSSARDLILIFVAFELMSIPLYVLAGFLKNQDEAVEAALKFFLVGSVSSAVMAYGLSFVYGATRTTDLARVAQTFSAGQPLLLLGMLAVFAGFAFKIAAFPFHMWVPDTYEAASTPFVAWLSVAPKAAGFVALFRIYFEGMGERAAAWIPITAGLAAITIVGGNLMALPQQNTKRLLAYSGIAHIGYMLVGFASASASGTAMVLFYLVAYVFGNMGAFLVVEAVARSERSEATAALRGLAQRSPLLALAMLYWLVLLGAVLTVVALFYYLVVAKRMYIEPPASSAGRIELSRSLALAVILCALGVVALGVYPKPIVMAALCVAAPLF